MSIPRLDPPARVLVTTIGLDGHDRGSRIVAAFLRDAGMDVIYTPPWQSIAGVVKLATEEDVDTLGVSSLATDHLIVPQLIEALQEADFPMSGSSWAASCRLMSSRRCWPLESALYLVQAPRATRSSNMSRRSQLDRGRRATPNYGSGRDDSRSRSTCSAGLRS